jgi:putative chitinase
MFKTWPNRFATIDSAKPFVGHPEALANHVYANRMGNKSPGDGWKYRGRGAIQITGRTNYVCVGKECGLPLAEQPDLAADPENALLLACGYWTYHNLSVWAARLDFKGLTRAINGGYNGLEERRRLLSQLALEYEHAVRALQ